MKLSIDIYLPATGALALSGALVVAWTGNLLADGGSWPILLGLFGIGLTLIAAAPAILLYRWSRDRHMVRRHLDAICRLDPRDSHTGSTAGDVPPLSKNNPWHELAGRVKETIEQHSRRVQELEHAKTALEIRCRRAITECERSQAVLVGVSDPIIVVDDYDEVVLANPGAQELFGFDIEKQENRAVGQLLRCQKLVELLATTCHHNTLGTRTGEVEIVDEGGNSHWYRVTAAKLARGGDAADRHESGPSGAVAVLRDIGDQKALQKRNAEFVSAVSHEMKTPLAGIKAYVELLVDGDAEDEETQEEFLDVISSQTDRLQRLVDNMLNLARIEAGVVAVNKKSLSLNELLDEAAHVVQPAAEAKQIELAAEPSPMYLGVLADRDMLLQSAINLLSNAIKYTPNGGRVTLRSRLADDKVLFEVEDTGVGLGEEDCRRVFDKFYRVHKDKNMAPGTGLGLPLAKHIVEDVHGGTLSVQSTPGAGSTFTVSLPGSGQMA